ncbi:hypothetical protein ACLVWU_13320 [Bdellovibrio sp. HCB290]|uniref:hypothetical protein n=1 Tax=Bdellovibrio sp. HCB290 TaxID=3394356 RepID=UPI0039B3A4AC
MKYLVLSSVLAIALGIWVRHNDVVHKKNTNVNTKKLSLAQVIYSLCFAYPFCAFYVWLENLL